MVQVPLDPLALVGQSPDLLAQTRPDSRRCQTIFYCMLPQNYMQLFLCAQAHPLLFLACGDRPRSSQQIGQSAVSLKARTTAPNKNSSAAPLEQIELGVSRIRKPGTSDKLAGACIVQSQDLLRDPGGFCKQDLNSSTWSPRSVHPRCQLQLALQKEIGARTAGGILQAYILQEVKGHRCTSEWGI